MTRRLVQLLLASAAIASMLPASADAQVDTLTISGTPIMEIAVVDEDGGRFSEIRSALRTRDGTVVADGNVLRFFDDRGIPLRVAGGDGVEPGRFGRLIWIAPMRGDSLLGFDLQSGWATIFDAEGQLAREFRLAVHPEHAQAIPQGIFRDGSILSIAGPPEEEPDSAGRGYRLNIAFTISSTEERVRGLVFPVVQQWCPEPGCARRRSNVRALWATGSNEFYYYRPDRFEITVYGMSGVHARVMPLDDVVPSTGNDTIPAVQEMRTDRSGRIWLHIGATEWRVIDIRGRLLHIVFVPQTLRLWSTGDDHVLGEAREADGIPRVRMHRLERCTTPCRFDD